MGSNAINGIIAVGTAIVALAVVAVLVSKNAQTGQVLTSAGKALSAGITAAVSPVASATGLGSVASPVDMVYS